MKTFDMPDLGEGLQEAEIVTWHVAVGDKVVADQPVVSVETDKAVVEVPAPFPGTVAKLFAEAGGVIAVGAPLIAFEDATGADSGTVAGHLPAESEQPKTAPSGAAGRASSSQIKATPAVRALARRLEVDLASVGPSGPDGQITTGDVQRVAAVLSEVEPAVPLRGMRRTMARRMAQAHQEVVPATIFDEADIGGWQSGSDVTVRLVEAIIAGAQTTPIINAWFESGSEALRTLSKISVGIAVDTPDGLLVPVLRDVAARARPDLRDGLEQLKQDAIARRIPPDELRGATITLSNFGVLGAGRFAQLVVVPPQVAIVGAGRIHSTVAIEDGAPVARRALPLSVTFDHRVVSGGEAARFFATMIESLEKPD